MVFDGYACAGKVYFQKMLPSTLTCESMTLKGHQRHVDLVMSNCNKVSLNTSIPSGDR